MTSTRARSSDYPFYLEPGSIQLLTIPVATKPVDYYIHSPEYMGQAFGVGQVIAIHAKNFDVHYQQRDQSFLPIPDLRMDEVLRSATMQFQRFVLVGRLTYFDANGRPHLDEITCDLANQVLGQFNHPIHPILFVVECLYLDQDLTRAHRTKRLMAAEEITNWLKYNGGVSHFRFVDAATTIQDKQELARHFNRVLWSRWMAVYENKNENYVVTKSN